MTYQFDKGQHRTFSAIISGNETSIFVSKHSSLKQKVVSYSICSSLYFTDCTLDKLYLKILLQRSITDESTPLTE